MSRGPGLAHACGAGALLALSHLGFGIWPLFFVALMLFWHAIERSTAMAFGIGACFGAVAYGVGYAWLIQGLVRLTGDTTSAVGLWVVNGIWFAAGFAACGVATRSLRRLRWPLVVAGPLPLVAVEALQPQVFAAPLGAALLPVLPFAQAAELGGGLALTTLAATLAAGLANGAADFRAGHGLTKLVWAAAALAIALGAGALRIGWLLAHPSSETLDIGVVQAAIAPEEKRRLPEASRDRHAELAGRFGNGEAPDLVVWPEGAYPRALRRRLPLEGSLIRGELEVPLLFGGVAQDGHPGGPKTTNTAFLVERDGWIRQVVDKRQLIPLAETPRLAGVDWGSFPGASEFRAGAEIGVLELDGHRVAVPICYEAADGRGVRRVVRSTGAALLITLAEDGWFVGTREPRIHFALARLRAIEHRRWLVRAANLGVSGVVDPVGRVRTRSSVHDATTLTARVAWRNDMSTYARYGEKPVWLALAALALAVRPRRRA